jgi:hypothetical protein
MRNILFGLKGKQTFLTALGIERTHPIITAITALAHPKTILDTFAFLYKPTFARPSRTLPHIPHIHTFHTPFYIPPS